jgi:N-methylhydantoinase A
LHRTIVAVDTGGTFTDIVILRDGTLSVLKVPSTPDDPARAVIEGVAAFAPELLIHGSTVATNALLERRGAVVALVTNRGFEDIIEIGRQNRPHLYALSDTRPSPLVERDMRFGVSGRLDYRGVEIEQIDESDVVALKEQLKAADSIAVCLLHSYASDVHEQRIAALLGDITKHLSISSEILPEYREYERTSTTVVNAYVAPLMQSYLARLEAGTAARVSVMGSGGGAVPIAAARREPVHTVLSGPAGGVAGALASAEANGFTNIITFDMGGTSTDVSLCPGAPLHTRDFMIAGMPVAIPVLDIHTVGAGGGSVAWVDAAGALRVGPRSSGAQPGPICYGRGGTDVTVTDANVWLGRLPVSAFLGGEQTLDRDAVQPQLTKLAARLGMSIDATAEGIITIANSTMEGALRVISVERGYDPIDFVLVAFGGAAGLHAVELAERLDIPRIMVPPNPGVLSAYGMLASPVRKAAARTVLQRVDLENVFSELESSARAAMREEGLTDAQITLTRRIDARYRGQSHELTVRADDWHEAFHNAHEQRYGYSTRNADVEAVTLRVEATSPRPVLPAYARTTSANSDTSARVFMSGSWLEARISARSNVTAQPLSGPLVVTEYSATTWVPAGWQVSQTDSGALLITKA